MITAASECKGESRRGFTLIELLVVVAILAILTAVTVLIIDPDQLLAQSRDAGRISDLATLNAAVLLYQSTQSGGSYSLGMPATVYNSVPDRSATSTAGTNCGTMGLPAMPTGYSWHCAASSTYRSTAGTGWLPVNFAAIQEAPPFGSLPVDPVNRTSSRLFYTYTTDGSLFELTAAMESTKYQLGGSNDKILHDGAPLATVYAKGTSDTLEPLDYNDPTLAAYWPMREGSGAITHDGSGNNDTLTLSNTTWTAGRKTNALNFGSSQSLGTLASGISINQISYTIAAWVLFPLPTTSGGWRTLARSSASNGDHQILVDSGGNLGVYDNNYNTQFHSSGYNISSLFGWHHFAAVGQGTGTSFYIDGVFVGTATFKSNEQINWIGNYGGGSMGQNFGTVEDLRIYTRALGASEIQALYNGGK